MHDGIDLAAPTGTDIYATGNGTVVKAKRESSYGNLVEINHGFGYRTVYAHLSKIFVKAGDSVKRGQVIGHVGSTGRSTGPHLHYEVRYRGTPVNPEIYFDKNQDAGLIEQINPINSDENEIEEQ
jgi:murein DD-endopeptidase MepM/ murein hydrolase activator NlpD